MSASNRQLGRFLERSKGRLAFLGFLTHGLPGRLADPALAYLRQSSQDINPIGHPVTFWPLSYAVSSPAPLQGSQCDHRPGTHTVSRVLGRGASVGADSWLTER